MRLYEVIAVNEKSGAVTIVTNGEPLTHNEACTVAKRFHVHPARRIQLREIPLPSARATAAA